MSLLSQGTDQKLFLVIGRLSADRLLSERAPGASRFFSATSHNPARVNHEVSAPDRLRSDGLQRRLQHNYILGPRRLNGLVTT